MKTFAKIKNILECYDKIGVKSDPPLVIPFIRKDENVLGWCEIIPYDMV